MWETMEGRKKTHVRCRGEEGGSATFSGSEAASPELSGFYACARAHYGHNSSKESSRNILKVELLKTSVA